MFVLYLIKTSTICQISLLLLQFQFFYEYPYEQLKIFLCQLFINRFSNDQIC